ncbi:uncharacterized protein LOC144112548 [Amblyomma americanum]
MLALRQSRPSLSGLSGIRTYFSAPPKTSPRPTSWPGNSPLTQVRVNFLSLVMRNLTGRCTGESSPFTSGRPRLLPATKSSGVTVISPSPASSKSHLLRWSPSRAERCRALSSITQRSRQYESTSAPSLLVTGVGTIGHRVDVCPCPVEERCSYCGQNVGKAALGMAPHECKPACMVCGQAHLTGSQACKGKFRRLQQAPGTPAARSLKGLPPTRHSESPGIVQGGASGGKAGSTATNNAALPNARRPTRTCHIFPPRSRQRGRHQRRHMNRVLALAFQAGEFPDLGGSGPSTAAASKKSSKKNPARTEVPGRIMGCLLG